MCWIAARRPSDFELEGATPAAPTRRRHWLASFYPVRVGDELIGVGTVVVDVTERKRAEMRLRHLADHDPLTGIFNRRRLIEELDRQLRYAARSGRSGAVLVFDVDHLKFANDTYGHATGDTILKAVAEVLQSRTRETDIVARHAGDEFTVILPEATDDDALLVARDIRELLGERQVSPPIMISAGVALFTGEEEITADEILVCADTALYEAKEHGGDQARVYRGQASGALRWVQRIRSALAEDRFVLYGQPIIDLQTGLIARRELLIRMLSDNGEIVSPGTFIPTAERFGLIREIDRWVTAAGLRVALGGQPVAINLSGYSIGEQSIIALVQDAIAQGLTPASVSFEITETAAMTNLTAARSFAGTLADLGCTVALDDFGTGFGSFSYLKHIPARYLKIDIEFVRDLATDETDQQVVKAIVGIAHSLNKLTSRKASRTLKRSRCCARTKSTMPRDSTSADRSCWPRAPASEADVRSVAAIGPGGSDDRASERGQPPRPLARRRRAAHAASNGSIEPSARHSTCAPSRVVRSSEASVEASSACAPASTSRRVNCSRQERSASREASWSGGSSVALGAGGRDRTAGALRRLEDDRAHKLEKRIDDSLRTIAGGRNRVQRRGDAVAGPADGGLGEFRFASGKVVIDRAAGRATLFQHLGKRRSNDAVTAHGFGGGPDHPLLCAQHLSGSSLTSTRVLVDWRRALVCPS